MGYALRQTKARHHQPCAPPLYTNPTADEKEHCNCRKRAQQEPPTVGHDLIVMCRHPISALRLDKDAAFTVWVGNLTALAVPDARPQVLSY